MTHASPAPTARTPPPLIANAEQLDALLAELSRSDGAVAVDTEANSFHRYFERMCLLQLAADGRVALVDPLAVDVAPLVAHLATRRLLLHGADYDLRLLYRGWGFRAREVFDTMLAAQLLGEKEIGLAALLGKRVGVTLDKAHQRADWTERPLTGDLLAYAAADVAHLHALQESLAADLAAKGRLPWHEEECRRLAALDLVERETDVENDWRIKGSNGVSSKERAFLRELWLAREERAREIDRPVFRVAHNEKLLAAARLAAAGESDPEKLFGGGPRPVPTSLARGVRAAIARAKEIPPASWPGPRRGEPVEANPALERAVEKLKKRRDAAALALGLDPGVVASRATMASAAGAVLTGIEGAAGIAAATGISRWRAEILLG